MKTNELEPHNAWLTEWIEWKSESFKEEPRTGIPRGESLPIPRQKFLAALYILLYGGIYHNLKDIAKKIGASLSLVLKWRTEERFNALIGSLAKEFVGNWAKAYFMFNRTLRNLKSKKEIRELSELIDQMVLHASQTWGYAVQTEFFKFVDESIDKHRDITSLTGMLAVCVPILNRSENQKMKIKLIKEIEKLLQSMIDGIKNDTKKALHANNLKQVEEGIDALASLSSSLAIQNNNQVLGGIKTRAPR